MIRYGRTQSIYNFQITNFHVFSNSVDVLSPLLSKLVRYVLIYTNFTSYKVSNDFTTDKKCYPRVNEHNRSMGKTNKPPL